LKRRVERAAKAMLAYPVFKEIRVPVKEDLIDCTVDLVTDLLHLAKVKWQADPDYILRVARMHFEAEQGKEVCHEHPR
jgi:hypothetical protein